MGKQSDLPMGHIYWIAVLELRPRSKSSTFSTWKTHHFHQHALTHVHQITSTVSADHTLDTFWAGSSSGQNQNGFTFLCWRESNVSLKAKGNFAWGRISKSAWPNTMGLMINGPAWFTVILKQSLFPDSISFGSLRGENIHSGSTASPEKASWCQNYRQVAYRGEGTKIWADGTHPPMV